LEHRGVPEEHKGLHDSLYGDGEGHTDNSKTAKLDGKSDWLVETFLDKFEGYKMTGVFEIKDSTDKVQYVGYSRNIHVVVKSLLAEKGADSVKGVRAETFTFASREIMEQRVQDWIESLGYTPAGNQEGSSWDRSIGDAAKVGMNEEEKKKYESNKLKMRKAMADSKLIDDMPQLTVEEKLSRRNLELAVEGDDWSAEIDRQTADTIVSPFQKGDVGAGKGKEESDVEFTIESVDKALDEVRPYLIADGGNCKVVGVDQETGDVSLMLEGACGTCPSSTVTLSMGIERALREKFGSRLGQVVRVEGETKALLSVEVCEEILDWVTPAVENLGGTMEILSVDSPSGSVTIKYSGPEKLTYGIELTLQDDPRVKSVEFVK